MSNTTERDYLGRPLAVGDTVAFIWHNRICSYLRKGVIARLTPCFIILESGVKVSYDKAVKA